MNNPIVYHTEAFKFEKLDGAEKKYILKGNAMPLNETSRNGVYYRPESIKATYQTLEGVPFLFAHQQNKINDVLGKVEKVGLNDTHVTYEVEIDPEEKEFIRKSEKGYIKNVSVGVMIDPNTVEFDEKNGIAAVDVLEFAELSSAPVPGYRNTSALIGKEQVIMLAESLGKTEIAKKLKEQKDPEDKKETEDEEDDKKETTDPEEDDKKESVDEDEEDKKETNSDDEDKKESTEDDEKKETLEESDEEKSIDSKIEDLYEKFEELTNMMSALSSKVDTLMEDVEEEEKEQTEPEKEEEPKEAEESEPEKDKEEEPEKQKEEKDIEPEKEEIKDTKAISEEALKLSNANKKEEFNNIQKSKKEAKNFADLLLKNKRY